MNIDGVGFVWQKQNKKLFFFQKLQLTGVKDNTNVLFVEPKFGYNQEDHQLKVFIDNFWIKNKQFSKNFVDNLLSLDAILFSLTIEKL